MGLGIAQDLVSRHGGLIEFDSAPGRTIFVISLPMDCRMNAKPLQVWLVDDDASIRWVLEKALKGSGMTARCFDQADNVLTALRADAPDVLMTDIRMPGRSGLDLLKEIQVSRPGLPVIVMTAHSDLDAAVAAYQGGAFEYLPKPFDIDKAVDLVRRAAQQATVSTDVEAARRSIPELLGQAAAMQQVFRAVGRLSRSSMTVLITGESGTGKELVARALHRHSPRSSKAFVALNTAAFTADLLESELFGHEKGAFTGADALRRGRFEQADGGTLFLDEIGDMSPALADATAARAGRGRILSRRRPDAGQGRRARDRRDPPGSGGAREIRPLPRGSAAPAQRDSHRNSAAARAARGYSRTAAPLFERGRPGAGRRAEIADGAGGDRAGDFRLARQRAPTRERLPAADGDGAGPRDSRRGHSAGSRRRAGRPRRNHDWVAKLSQWAEQELDCGNATAVGSSGAGSGAHFDSRRRCAKRTG